MNKFIKSILFFALCSAALHGQQVISTSGDYLQKSTGSVSFTIGEPFTETYIQGTKALTQGVQQPSLTATPIDEIVDIGIAINTFPNPTTSILYLEIGTEKLDGFWFLLIDLGGRTVYKNNVTEVKTDISFENLATGTYILKIFMESKEIRTFKIVKQ
jgi:hypothetical protein